MNAIFNGYDLVFFLLTNTALAVMCLGFFGVFATRRNLIIIIISLELVLLSLNILFLTFSIYLDDLVGQFFSLLILTIAGAESSIGLALLVIYHRRVGLISIREISTLKG
jgi:NADH-quinone oxidoreductase subunit K